MAADSRLAAVVLAAGEGKRMKSPLAKVLHEVAGRSLVVWAVEAALAAGARRVVVVVGHQRELVGELLSNRYGDKVETAVQAQQRGTGDAVIAGLTVLVDEADEVPILDMFRIVDHMIAQGYVRIAVEDKLGNHEIELTKAGRKLT